METDQAEDSELPTGMDIQEGEQCKFNVGSFKMVKVVRSEDFLYRNDALTKAAKVCFL